MRTMADHAKRAGWTTSQTVGPTAPNLEDGSFQRPALCNATTQIRLLHIVRDPERLGLNDSIRCTISVHHIEHVEHKYVAISYTWGPKDFSEAIELDGKVVRVRKNCWYALWQVRLHDVGEYYWIDSVSIDQSSHGEKQQQVLQMGPIYTRARMVAACIGAEGPDAKLFEPDDLTEDDLDHYLLDAIWYLSERSYLRRLWVVQECVLAGEVNVFCGARRIGWHQLKWKLKISAWLAQHGMLGSGLDVRNLNIFLEDHGDYRTKEGQRRWVEDLAIPRRTLVDAASAILRYGRRECYDPRDKILGIRSLMVPKAQSRIKINYREPLLHVLLKFATICGSLSDRGPDMNSLESNADKTVLEGRLLQVMEASSLLIEEFAQASDTFCNDMKRLIEGSRLQHFKSDNRMCAPIHVKIRAHGTYRIPFLHHGIFGADYGNRDTIFVVKRTRIKTCTCCKRYEDFYEPEERLYRGSLAGPMLNQDPVMEEVPREEDRTLALRRNVATMLAKDTKSHTFLNLHTGESRDPHAFRVPSSTQAHDLILCFQDSTSPDHRTFLVCREDAQRPMEIQILGKAKHLSTVASRGRSLRSTCFAAGTWKDPVDCHFTLRPRDLLALSIVPQSIPVFVDCLATGLFGLPVLCLKSLKNSSV